MTTTPSPYSPSLSTLQIAWDSSSLSALMKCPRYYQLSILQGWGGSKVDLEFGGFFATAVEIYKKALLDGKSWEDAQYDAFSYAFEKSGRYDILYDSGDTLNTVWVPWGGVYTRQWHCLGTEKYKNAKGNAAKCPRSHKGVWSEDEAPSICGDCGSDIEVLDNWVPGHPSKDRYSLLRLVAWYCEENKSSHLQPYAFPNGQPAVELSFRFPADWQSPFGDTYIICGHIDSIMSFGKEHFIADNKTTKSALGALYWSGYAPNIQVEVYDLAGSILFQDLGLKGVLIEGAQVLQSGARFGQGIVYRTDAQRNETLRELRHWIRTAEEYAMADYWPRNTAACFNCGFKLVCSKDPQTRDMYLRSNFQQRTPWNPLEER